MSRARIWRSSEIWPKSRSFAREETCREENWGAFMRLRCGAWIGMPLSGREPQVLERIKSIAVLATAAHRGFQSLKGPILGF